MGVIEDLIKKYPFYFLMLILTVLIMGCGVIVSFLEHDPAPFYTAMGATSGLWFLVLMGTLIAMDV